MKVLHLAAGNRWTGAAAPAFAEVESLRAAGVDAAYAYVGGYRLEAKIGHLPFTHPVIEKAQNPASLYRCAARIGRLVDREGFDVLHAHLTWDHWLGWLAARGRRVRLARTFHARRTLRTDPATRRLVRACHSVFVVNDDFRDAPLLAGRDVTFTPPPLDLRQFRPDGPSARAQHGIDAAAPLVAVIGKLSPDRGFEDALRTFALLRASKPGVRMMVIGHGEHRATLEHLASGLGITDALHWAGYHEEDLADHYRAADLLLFTARGSDEGHRAVLEAMGCGVPVASYPLEGISALLPPEGIAPGAEPQSLATLAAVLLDAEPGGLRLRAREQAERFGYAEAARRLINGYNR